MAAKKTSNNLPGPLNKKGVRLWFWLMIVAPAFFLLYFFLFNNVSPTRQAEKYPPLSSPADIGSTLHFGNGNYTVGRDKKIYITREISLVNNTVAAEAGLTFIVVPLQLPRQAPEPNPENWWLQDGEGVRYPLLKATGFNPAINTAKDGVSAMDGEKFLIYKAPRDTKTFYVVYQQGQTTLSWRIK